ncbi:MAG: hypothetical protein FWE93_00695 [Alphaproteobacteria bacterium]|nr:hypothetical protein [Alphaproteobacteria bacterium]
MPIKKLVVHLGGPKTGSSSIQRTLYNNSELLEKNGFRYLHEWWVSHYKVFQCLFSSCRIPKNPDLWSYMTAEERADYEQVQMEQMLHACKDSDGKTMIMSAEFAVDFALVPDYSEKFQSFLKEYFSDVEVQIILYIRNPVEWQISRWQEDKKKGCIVKSLNEDWHQKFESYHNIHLRTFVSKFKDMITLVKFEDAVKDEDGLVGSFLKLTGFPESELNELKVFRTNESVCAEAMEFIKFAEDVEPTFNKSWNLNPKRTYVDCFPLFSIKGTKFDFSWRDKLAMLERNREGIQWLKDNAGIDYTDYKVEEKPEPETYSEETLNGFIEAFLKISSVLQKLFLDFFEKKYSETGQTKFRRLYANESIPRIIYEREQNLRRFHRYPKWFIHFLCLFVPKKKNRKHIRKKYIKR